MTLRQYKRFAGFIGKKTLGTKLAPNYSDQWDLFVFLRKFKILIAGFIKNPTNKTLRKVFFLVVRGVQVIPKPDRTTGLFTGLPVRPNPEHTGLPVIL